MKHVLVFGTFDHLHPGHHFVIEQAQARGRVTVIVARDANVAHIKGFHPDHSEQERCQAIKNQFPDISVQLGDADDYLQPIRDMQPDLILLGYDQKLPPDINEEDLPCPIERLPAFEPDKFKSSIMRQQL